MVNFSTLVCSGCFFMTERIYSMNQVSLQALLEAGCHFGHKAERWHPRASEFIFTEKDGVHIIDLAKTKAGLDAAMTFVSDLVGNGGEVLFVGTKRQAKQIVKAAALDAGAPYMVERWIGGFMTNWEGIHRNIKKINSLADGQADGSWKKFPKHEQFKLARRLNRLKIFYGGVLTLNSMPSAIFVVDVKKEIAAVREAQRCGLPVVAIVDTNSNPTDIDYIVPANDDAIGSISIVTEAIASAYKSGHDTWLKKQADVLAKKEADKQKAEAAVKPEVKKVEVKEAPAVDTSKLETKAKKAAKKEVVAETPKAV